MRGGRESKPDEILLLSDGILTIGVAVYLYAEYQGKIYKCYHRPWNRKTRESEDEIEKGETRDLKDFVKDLGYLYLYREILFFSERLSKLYLDTGCCSELYQFGTVDNITPKEIKQKWVILYLYDERIGCSCKRSGCEKGLFAY